MVQRRLAAILALDVVGYSKRMQADEVATLERLAALRADLLQPAFETWRGRVFKEMGDGLLVEFASVVDAVECANAIQVGAAGIANPDAAMPVRIGVHFGDVIVEGDDLFGDGINVAARLESIAPAGGICISGSVHELVAPRVDLQFRPMGPQRLKNIAQPVPVFHVVPAGPDARGTAVVLRPIRPSLFRRPLTWIAIAVLAVAGIVAFGFYHTTGGGLFQSAATTVDTTSVLGNGRRHAQVFADCDDCPKMVVIAGGTLLMGAPPEGIRDGRYGSDQGPQRLVSVAPYAIGQNEVTVGAFERFLADSGHARPTGCRTWEDGVSSLRQDRSFAAPGFPQTEQHPVVCVSWQDAQAYVDWLARKTGKPYRLASEAEWEFAARAGSDQRYSYGEDESDLCRHANTADASARLKWANWVTADCNDGQVFTAPVGSYQPNAFGVYDVYGNVREWVKDCWHNTFHDAPSDARPWVTGGDCQQRVIRGGSWDTKPELTGSSWRARLPSTTRDFLYGFRVARDLTE